jgi:lipooligosaccharide transport system permease protein
MTSRAAVRYFETRVRVYRHTWRGSVISTFLNPILYLTAMGLGLGTLVDEGAGRTSLEGFSYLEFLAPGLLAATAMQTAVGDASYPVMAGIRWIRSYEATLASPIGIRDLTLGHLLWVLAKVGFSSLVFVVVMVGFGVADPIRGAASLAPALLTGMAFGAPVMAYTANLQDAQGIAALFRFGVVPMFLFSGVFFPIDQLPRLLELVAYLTPLWHGVELTRAVALGVPTISSPLLSVAYLVAWFALGTIAAIAVLRRKLVI